MTSDGNTSCAGRGDDAGLEGAGDTAQPPPPPGLPDDVRLRVLGLASAALPTLAEDDLPRTLRPFARFTASRRARAAAPALAAALEDDRAFRERVAETLRDDPLAGAVAAGAVPPAADPVHAAALAYLLRPPGWGDLLAGAATAAQDRARRRSDEAAGAQVVRLADQLEAARAQLREDARRSRAELAQAGQQVDALRRQLRGQAQAVRQAQQAAAAAAAEVAGERERSAATQSDLQAQLRRGQQRLAEAEAAAEAVRRTGRDGRTAGDARLWLLLDTVVNAAQGLRRELALTPPAERPADFVEASAGAPIEIPAGGVDDAGQLDRLLALPRVHLVVDGYNVTKTGYGELALEAQRARLVSVVAGLAAQTNAEVTVVFDGAERLPVAPAAPRGVRVLFSAIGETADELICRLVRAEPRGRPVVVVSTDREVADGVRRAGAYPVRSTVLLTRLGRA